MLNIQFLLNPLKPPAGLTRVDGLHIMRSDGAPTSLLAGSVLSRSSWQSPECHITQPRYKHECDGKANHNGMAHIFGRDFTYKPHIQVDMSAAVMSIPFA